MKKINIGFDIGITSVGWCVSDAETGIPLICYKNGQKKFWYGVRLFPESADAKTGTTNASARRAKREQRRQIRRRKLRNIDFIKLLIDSNLLDKNLFGNDKEKYPQIFRDEIIRKTSIHNIDLPQILFLKLNSLPKNDLEKFINDKTKVNKIFNYQTANINEILIVLYNYLQHRGFFYEEDSENNDKNKTADNEKKSTNDKKQEIKHKKGDFPSLTQYIVFNNTQSYIGFDGNTSISHEDWLKEIEQFINKNKNLISSKTNFDRFKNSFLDIYNRQRSYMYGPGPKANGKCSEYGILKKYGTNDLPIKTLWDSKIGKCSLYKEENRYISTSSYAELFDYLNNIQNLRKKQGDIGWRIKRNEKMEILFDFLNDKKSNVIGKKNIKNKIKLQKKEQFNYEYWPDKIICKNIKFIIDWIEENKLIQGFRNNLINSIKSITDNKKSFHSDEFDLIDQLVYLKYSKNNNFYKNIFPKAIEDLLKRNIILSDKTKQYIEQLKNIKLEQIENLRENIFIKSKPSNYSLKALSTFIPYLLIDEEGHEQQYIRKYYLESTVNKNILTNSPKLNNFTEEKIKEINNELFNQPISETAKRSIRETLKIFNALSKKFNKCKIENIIIEVAREKNSAEEANFVSKMQKEKKTINDKFKDEIEEYTKAHPNANTNTSLLKMLLWDEQNSYDPYEIDKKIPKKDVFTSKVQIDHIIPISKCGIDSRFNKVLTFSENNHKKGDRTPWEYINEKNTSKFEDFKKYWNLTVFSNKNDNSKKIEVLSYDGTCQDYVKQFGGSSLNDTRTATTFVNDIFQKNIDSKIKVINGKVTSLLRKKIFHNNRNFGINSILPFKDRNFYRHHADDALVLAYIESDKKLKEWLKWIEKNNADQNAHMGDGILNKETGELMFSFIDENKEVQRKFEKFYYDNKIAKENQIYNNEPFFSRLINKNKTENGTEFFNETLYSGIINKETNKIQIITKLNLLEEDDKVLCNYFGKKPKEKNKIILKSGKPIDTDKQYQQIYDKLNEIYQDSIVKGCKKPFADWVAESDQKAKNAIKIQINEKDLYIKYLYVIGKVSSASNIFENKKLITSKTKTNFFSSFNSIFYYYNKKDPNTILNFFNIKDKNFRSIKNIKQDKDIQIIYKGDIYLQKNSNTLWYVVGGVANKDKPINSTIEIKPLNKKNKFYKAIDFEGSKWNVYGELEQNSIIELIPSNIEQNRLASKWVVKCMQDKDEKLHITSTIDQSTKILTLIGKKPESRTILPFKKFINEYKPINLNVLGQ